MEDQGHLNPDVEGTSEEQELQVVKNSQALITKSIQEEIADTAGAEDDDVDESTGTSDIEESYHEADKTHQEVLELYEVVHTFDPTPRRSTRNQSRKLILDEDKKNSEEGNESQE